MNSVSTIHRDHPAHTYLGSPDKCQCLRMALTTLLCSCRRQLKTDSRTLRSKLHALLTCSVWQEECKIRRKEMKNIVAAGSNSPVTKEGRSQSQGGHLCNTVQTPSKAGIPTAVWFCYQRQKWVRKNHKGNSFFFPFIFKEMADKPFLWRSERKMKASFLPLWKLNHAIRIDAVHRNT